MGCNYYAIKRADSDLKSKIIEAVNADNFDAAIELIPHQIHIGKSSGGWQFIFNHNNWRYFEDSLESLKAFLLSSDIFDEYDERISYDGYWHWVLKNAVIYPDPILNVKGALSFWRPQGKLIDEIMERQFSAV